MGSLYRWHYCYHSTFGVRMYNLFRSRDNFLVSTFSINDVITAQHSIGIGIFIAFGNYSVSVSSEIEHNSTSAKCIRKYVERNVEKTIFSVAWWWRCYFLFFAIWLNYAPFHLFLPLSLSSNLFHFVGSHSHAHTKCSYHDRNTCHHIVWCHFKLSPSTPHRM